MAASLFSVTLPFSKLPLFLSHCSGAAVYLSPMPWCAVKQLARLLLGLCSLPAQHSQSFADLENLCVLSSLFHCYGQVAKDVKRL